MVVPGVELAADKLTVPGPHLEPPTGVVGAVGVALTVTGKLVAVVALQPLALV